MLTSSPEVPISVRLIQGLFRVASGRVRSFLIGYHLLQNQVMSQHDFLSTRTDIKYKKNFHVKRQASNFLNEGDTVNIKPELSGRHVLAESVQDQQHSQHIVHVEENHV